MNNQAATGRTLEYGEAPVLAALVAGGDLPPVAERLPQDPIVIAPAHRIGAYGGTMVIPGAPGWINDEYMRQWGLTVPVDGEALLGNVFATYEPNADGSVFTIRLRDGLRWSDGEPFTTEDIGFWFDHDAANTELNPDGLGNLKVGGMMATLNVVDAVTFQFRFAGSYPMLPNNMMRWFPDSFLAAHYMGQFHPDVAGRDKAESAAKEAGFTTWMAYWQEYLIWSNFNTELPVVHPWKLDRKSDNQITPQDAWSHYTREDYRLPVGVLAVTVSECSAQDLPVLPDPQTFAEHVLIDFSKFGTNQIKRKSSLLRDFAVARGWQFRVAGP